MRQKKCGYRRVMAGFLALTMMALTLGGCGSRPQSNGEKERLRLPKQVVSLAEAPALSGSPVTLTRKDSEPLAVFTKDLFEEALVAARATNAENPVLSPVSVYLAMMVTAYTNEAPDEGQIAEWETLFGVPQDQWNDWGTRLMKHMNWSKGDSCVSAANSLWLDTGMSLSEDVLQRISQKLYVDVYQGDLQGNDIVEAINRWVDHQSRGMIPQFKDEPYEDAVVMSILNAVYLEAKWRMPFAASGIQEKIFYTAQNEEVTAEFMTDMLCQRAYVQQERWDGVLLPYLNGNLAFAALRPTAGQTVDELLLSLEAEDWAICCDQAVDTLMNFSIPKFTVEYRQVLTDVLAQMGLNRVLADSGIGVGQTVKIQVDQDGTKAVAVTEMTAAGAIEIPEEPPLEIHFDQPFVYAVIDTATQIPLFVGVLDRPVQ